MQTLVFQPPDPCPYAPYHHCAPACHTPALGWLVFAFLNVYIPGEKLRVFKTSASSLMPPATSRCLPGICFSLHPISNGQVDLGLQLRHHLGQCWAVMVPQLSRLQKGSFIARSVPETAAVMVELKSVSSARRPLSRQRGLSQVAELLAAWHRALFSGRQRPHQICLGVLCSKNKPAGGG